MHSVTIIIIIIIIAMETCKGSTPCLKELKKHVTHRLMYIEMDNVIRSLTKANIMYTSTMF